MFDCHKQGVLYKKTHQWKKRRLLIVTQACCSSIKAANQTLQVKSFFKGTDQTVLPSLRLFSSLLTGGARGAMMKNDGGVILFWLLLLFTLYARGKSESVNILLYS